MAVQHETVMYDVHDCKVYPLTADTDSASPTYGAAVDVPGIAEIGLDPNLVTAELKGDARVMAKKGRIDRMNFKATYGKLSLDVLGVILDGTVSDPNTNEARFDLLGTNSLPYFKLEAKIEDVDEEIGDLHTVLFKCQLTGGTLLTGQSDQFGQPTLELEAIGPDHLATPMWRVRLLSTPTNLSA